MEDIADSVGGTTVDVLFSIENEVEVRRGFQDYLENLRSRDEWMVKLQNS